MSLDLRPSSGVSNVVTHRVTTATENPDRARPSVASHGPGVGTALLALGHHRRYPAGATLIAQESHSDRLLSIVSGFVAEERLSKDGARTICNIHGPAELLGELSLLGADVADTFAVAITDCVVVSIPCRLVRDRLRDADPFVLQLLDLVTRRERATARTLVDLARASADIRVSRRILELAERWGRPCADGLSIPVPLRQRDLAAWATVSPQAAAKALSALRRDSIVETGRRRLLVRDIARLEERCER